MIQYLIDWFNLYIVHFGGWITFIFACSIYSKGLPNMKLLPNMFRTAMILSDILSIFSSHSHHNFLTQLVGK